MIFKNKKLILLMLLGLNFQLTICMEKNGTPEFSTAVNSLYDSLEEINNNFGASASIDIEKINIACDESGFPTVDAIKELFHRDYFPSRDISNITIREAESVGIKTEKVYGIFVNNRPVFFAKLNKSNAPSKNLMLLQKQYLNSLKWRRRFTNFKKMQNRRHLPIVVFLEKIFIFSNQSQEPVIMEVSHSARGKAVSDLITHKNKDIDPAIRRRAVIATGKGIGLFQQIFINYNRSDNPKDWITVKHGDFHSGNIFYNDADQQIYFIDNETMQGNQSISVDFIRFIKALFRRKADDVFELTQLYIESYVDSFPVEKRPALVEYLKYLNSLRGDGSLDDLIDKRVKMADFKQLLSDYLNKLSIDVQAVTTKS